MPEVSLQQIEAYRADSFQTSPALRVRNIDEAVGFVNRRGFCFFWPVTGYLFPSLWASVVGSRPVPDNHDDPGHVTWGWKDSLLGKGRCHYARMVRRRNIFIALDLIPTFYALSPNYGDPEYDYLDQYEQGRLTRDAKVIYETLLNEGPMNSVDLRKAVHMSKDYGGFNRALDDLQIEMKIMPVGVAEAGAWRYAFIYDLVPRRYPQLIEQAGSISEWEARAKLLNVYYQAMGAAPVKEASRLFGWSPDLINKAHRRLLDSEKLIPDIAVPDQKGDWFAHPDLFNM